MAGAARLPTHASTFDTCQLQRRWLLIIPAFGIQTIVLRAVIRAIVSSKQSLPTALSVDFTPYAARDGVSMHRRGGSCVRQCGARLAAVDAVITADTPTAN